MGRVEVVSHMEEEERARKRNERWLGTRPTRRSSADGPALLRARPTAPRPRCRRRAGRRGATAAAWGGSEPRRPRAPCGRHPSCGTRLFWRRRRGRPPVVWDSLPFKTRSRTLHTPTRVGCERKKQASERPGSGPLLLLGLAGRSAHRFANQSQPLEVSQRDESTRNRLRAVWWPDIGHLLSSQPACFICRRYRVRHELEFPLSPSPQRVSQASTVSLSFRSCAGWKQRRQLCRLGRYDEMSITGSSPGSRIS